jgi:hypothetical protein
MSNIKVGDSVMVVKPKPCGCTTAMGAVFKVSGFGRSGNFICMECGYKWKKDYLGIKGFKDYSFDASRLIKIAPPALPESLEREKELSV